MKINYIIPAIIVMLFSNPLLHAQFGPDVKTHDSPATNEKNVSMGIAFNGWIYESFLTDTGFMLVRSKDNGDTWVVLSTGGAANATYTEKIVVAGTDSNALRVYMLVNKVTNTGHTLLYVNKFDGLTGAFINNTSIYSAPNTVRDFDITTDYKFPSGLSSPYSIAIAYVQSGLVDSLFLVVSTDSGALYNHKEFIASTSNYFTKISLAYGISNSFNNGQFFLAWQKNISNIDTAGSIYVACTTGGILGPPSQPISVSFPYFANPSSGRNPRIAVSQSITADNDSNNITAVIVAEILKPAGNSAVSAFYSLKSTLGDIDTWKLADISPNNLNNLQPDVTFNPYANQFLLTWYNASASQLPYVVNNLNINQPNGWVFHNLNYADDTSGLQNAWPVVVVNPHNGQPAFSWTNTGDTGNIGQAMFDAEYRYPVPAITSLSPDTVIAGNSSFTLTVTGKNFESNSAIVWRNQLLPTTFVNPSQLYATVPNTFIQTADSIPVTVLTASPSGGGGTSNADTLYVLTVSAITDLDGFNIITAYPNPVSNRLTICYNFTQAQKLEISLYDLAGRPVKTIANIENALGNEIINIGVADLAEGIYHLVINTNTGKSVSKIVITR